VTVDTRVAAFVVYCEALFWLLPWSIAWPIAQTLIFTRHGAFALFGPTLLVRTLRGKAFAAVAAATLGLAIALALARTATLTQFDDEAAPFAAIIDAVPAGSRVAYFADNAYSRFAMERAYLNFDGWL